MINPNPAFLLVQKFEISPKGFTLGVKSEIEKKKLWTLNPKPSVMFGTSKSIIFFYNLKP